MRDIDGVCVVYVYSRMCRERPASSLTSGTGRSPFCMFKLF